MSLDEFTTVPPGLLTTVSEFRMTTDIIISEQSCQGWGKTKTVQGRVARPADADELKSLLDTCRTSGMPVTLRAGGNSYGDLITNTDGVIIDLSAFNDVLETDFENGTITAQAGVPLGVIVDRCLAAGWVPSCVPGSPFITIGGAIGNNVHGKDSFAKGHFGSCLASMRVLLADGRRVHASPQENREIFDAVIGGLGLCGIVLDATMHLTRVPSSYLDVAMVRFADVEEMIRRFESATAEWDMLVAWVDAFDCGGRGVLEKGRWRDAPTNGTPAQAVPARETGARLRRSLGTICRPFAARCSFRLINAAFFRAAAFLGKRRIKHFADFNFIVTTRIPEPPDLYPGGMIEIQILIPQENAAREIRRLLAVCREHKQESWWCGVKLHRAASTPVGFSGDGYSLSVNLPGSNVMGTGFSAFLDNLVGHVVDIGGRVYIGKDMVLRAGDIAEIFPDRDTFIRTKRRFDPSGLFESDLARRLNLK